MSVNRTIIAAISTLLLIGLAGVAAAADQATAPTSSTGTLSPSPGTAELQATLDTAKAGANARLESMRAAYSGWSIPSQPALVATATNARTAGLTADGTTDTTAALQALLNAKPAGATIYFPAGTYRIDGPISITKPVTLVGEKGTVFNCQRTTQSFVFSINKGGSTSSRMSGVTFTGITVEGPGIESGPTMIYANALQNVHVSYMKFHNVGTAAMRVNGCLNALVEDCVFDNVFRTGYGYGVCITDYSDGITVRDSFFVTKGRHGVATGTSTSPLPAAGYTKRVTVENCYFENFTDQAIDAHTETTGPYVAKGNVVANARVGINLRNGIGEVVDNAFINCPTGILLRNELGSVSSGAKVDKVVGNTIVGASGGMQVDKTNSVIRNNVIQGTGIGIYLGPTAYSPSSALISGNVQEGCSDGFYTVKASSDISLVNNWLKSGSTFQKVG